MWGYCWCWCWCWCCCCWCWGSRWAARQWRRSSVALRGDLTNPTMCLRSRTALTAELRRMPLMSRRRCRRRCRRRFFVDRDPLRPRLAIGETHAICGLRTRKHNLRDTELDCSVTPRDSGTGTDKVDIGAPAPAFDEVRPVPNGRTNPRDAVSRLRDWSRISTSTVPRQSRNDSTRRVSRCSCSCATEPSSTR